MEIVDNTLRPVDRWFANYGADHVNTTNQWLHVFCVPLIFWSIMVMLWCVPVPGTWFRAGTWAALSMFAVWMFYWRLSKPLAFGALVFFMIISWSSRFLYPQMGAKNFLLMGISVFVVAWVGQFVGHKIEGRKPSFFTDLTYLLIGPAWVLAKLFKKLGIPY